MKDEKKKLGDKEYFYTMYGMFAVACVQFTMSLFGAYLETWGFLFFAIFFGLYAYYFARRITKQELKELNKE